MPRVVNVAILELLQLSNRQNNTSAKFSTLRDTDEPARSVQKYMYYTAAVDELGGALEGIVATMQAAEVRRRYNFAACIQKQVAIGANHRFATVKQVCFSEKEKRLPYPTAL